MFCVCLGVMWGFCLYGDLLNFACNLFEQVVVLCFAAFCCVLLCFVDVCWCVVCGVIFVTLCYDI